MEGPQETIFEPGRNCWRVETATQAALLVDYANYYRAVFEAVRKARHSVFIVGWDIDSRIELVRGEQAQGLDCPVVLFDLLEWKARENPGIRIYLNKWNYSYFFARERELLAGLKWRWLTSPNIHYTTDSVIPFAACHHQKIVVVDDEVAFSGGMDIAPNRWDRREHYPVNPDRQDPDGMISTRKKKSYAPYHDVQMVVSGPAARGLAELARERWRRAAKSEAIALAAQASEVVPYCWPDSAGVDFRAVPIAIARTLPALWHEPAVREIESLLLDEISRAKKFIYIENQFLTVPKIAQALSDRLRKNPGLRVLMVSCDHPKGIMETKSMWTGRVIFRDILKTSGAADRFAMVYPISRTDGREEPVRIHSKLMIIDDRLLHVGSANINSRSMGFDTECDIVIEGRDEVARARIAALRTDLIREHSGLQAARIEKMIDHGTSIDSFLTYLTTSRQHLRKIDDERYRHTRFAALARAVADPDRPFIPVRRILPLLLGLAAIIALTLTWKFTPLSSYATPDEIVPFLRNFRHSVWALPVLLGIYVAAAFILFPVMVLDISTVMAFGLPWGPVMALMGASSSAAVGFIAGRLTKRQAPENRTTLADDKIRAYLKNLSIPGIAVLRMLPIAPFTVINFAIGKLGIPFPVFLVGTWLGLLPGLCAISFLRRPLLQLWQNPNPENILILVISAAAWAFVLGCVHKFARRWKNPQMRGQEA